MNIYRLSLLALLATACSTAPESPLEAEMAGADAPDAVLAPIFDPAEFEQLQSERAHSCANGSDEAHAGHRSPPIAIPTPGLRVDDDDPMKAPMARPLQPTHPPSIELLEQQDAYLARVAVLEQDLGGNPEAFELARAKEKARILGE